MRAFQINGEKCHGNTKFSFQLQLFYDYGSNPPLYPKWQAYFREFQPATLIVWGKNDYIFPGEGAHPYKHDLNNLEFHLLDTGHFALEEDGDKIAELITCFLAKHTDFLDTHPEYREICKLAA